MTPDHTLQELLKPRYKVIADWPGRQFFLTAIINIGEPIPDGRIRMFIDHEEQREWYLWNPNRNGNIDDYPHLFRKLEWWEERTAEEMPKYLKSKCARYVNKVVKYRGDIADVTDGQPGLLTMLLGHSEPATEAEYQNYINQTP